ncbi:MAG: glycosyltransferase, partial [Planctomycetota bacterium]
PQAPIGAQTQHTGEVVVLPENTKQLLDAKAMPETPNDLPRVLVIATVSFNWEAGGGVTMCNLFKGWPRDRIAQIYTHGVRNKDMSVCRTYYRIPPVDRQLELAEGRPLFGRGPVAKALRRARARRLLKLEEQYQEAIAFARKFRPDVAYVRPLDKPSSYWWLGHDLCELLGIPYVTHIMDDWPARYEDDAKAGSNPDIPQGVRGRLKASRMKSAVEQTIDRAAANIAISPEMASAFGERYGKPFEAFHNTVDANRWKQLRTARPAGRAGIDRPFVIRYVGGVMADKELRSLQEVAKAARSLHDSGLKVRFELHCGPAWNDAIDEHLTDAPVTGRGAFLKQEQLPAVLSAADLLVLPINFDERSRKYVGYSMQTKGPEYMATGTPILVYGPPANPNVRYARDAGWGIVIDQQDPQGECIARTIGGLIEEPTLGQRVAKRAEAFVEANHDASIIRTRFRRVLRTAAASRATS